jgi:hypothetical protein
VTDGDRPLPAASMQHPIQQIRDRLLQGLDKDYNVVDMGIVVDVISQLENYAITKEALEVQNFLHLASYLS